MKKWGYNQIGETLQDIKDLKSETVAEENILSSTVATDGPDIIAVQESIISDEYFARIYPEQVLWACPSAFENQEIESAEIFPMQVSVSSFSNHNQFTQTCHSQLEQQNNIKIKSKKKTEELPPPPYFHKLEDQKGLKSCITSEDFLLPAYLLSSKKSPDRIYGFYYLFVW